MRILGALAIVGCLLVPAIAGAVPPFARRYGFSCNTCHAGGPSKLGPFGEAFRDHGYQLPAEAEFLREPPLSLGDPSREKLFPGSTWPGQIPGNVPLGVLGLIGMRADLPRGGQAGHNEERLILEILAAGALGSHFSVFAELELKPDEAELERVFFVARSLFEDTLGPGRLGLKVGRAELEVFPVQPALRRAIQSPLSQRTSVGRSLFQLAAPSDVVMVLGVLPGRIKYALGASRGARPPDDVDGLDGFGRVHLKLGHDPFAEQGSAEVLVELGASAYFGRSPLAPEAATGTPASAGSTAFRRLMLDGRLRFRGLDVLAQAVVGHDDAPTGAAAVRSVAYLGEIEHAVLPWLLPYVRFEGIAFDGDVTADRQRVVTGLATFVRTNIRVRLEGTIGTLAREPHGVGGDLFFAF